MCDNGSVQFVKMKTNMKKLNYRCPIIENQLFHIEGKTSHRLEYNSDVGLSPHTVF